MALKQPICGVNEAGLYVLDEDYSYKYSTNFTILVPCGFVWDGASAPIRSSIRKDGLIRAAALVHDYLYRNTGEACSEPSFLLRLSRKGADKLFYKIMLEAGMSRWKAWKAYIAVRLFGRWAWNKHEQNRKSGRG